MKNKTPTSVIIIALYKGIFGVIEIILGGVLAVGSIFTHTLFSTNFIQTLIQNELLEDPQDFWANLFVAHNINFGLKISLQIAGFVIVLGIIKLLIAYAVWFRSERVRKISMVILGFLAVFAIYSIFIKFGIFKIIGLAIDLYIFYYLWKIFPKYLRAEARDENKTLQQ